jgi:hypothetical protein
MDLAEIDQAIAGAKARFDHADAPHEPDVLALIRAAETMRTELGSLGSLRIVEHNGSRLQVVTRALHDRLCIARIATPQEGTDPEVSHCAFCGLCYLRRSTSEAAANAGRMRNTGLDIAMGYVSNMVAAGLDVTVEQIGPGHARASGRVPGSDVEG